MNLRDLKRAGFDESRRVGKGVYRAKCSQCEALCINGCATHEIGCPNAARVRREREEEERDYA